MEIKSAIWGRGVGDKMKLTVILNIEIWLLNDPVAFQNFLENIFLFSNVFTYK